MRQFNVGDKFRFYQRNDNGSVVRCMDGFVSAIHGIDKFSDPSLWIYDFVLENCGVEGSFYFGESNKLVISRLDTFLKWELADAAEVSGEAADHG